MLLVIVVLVVNGVVWALERCWVLVGVLVVRWVSSCRAAWYCRDQAVGVEMD